MPRDGHIRVLSEQVANKIAAGEVVERPASVVKELIENAIDAGATRIDIAITAGGRKLIEVCDNGCGMMRDDALLCLERQATSKIRDVDDIEHITTLGFRGEAIPSIASVSRVILKTRRHESDVGTAITIAGGILHDVRDAGVPPGTTIEVRDLFFNVPARRKFLRAFQTEQAHIRTVFTFHALAHPDIGMSLTSDGRELTRLPPGATLEERVRDLFGTDFSSDLRPVDARMGDIRIYGFVSLPSQTRNDRSEQYIFINGRPATAPIIAYALREAYPPLAPDRKPIVLLFLEIPPDSVDVNVHPTKREVRFHKPAEIREALIRAVRDTLENRGELGVRSEELGVENKLGVRSEELGIGSGEAGFSGDIIVSDNEIANISDIWAVLREALTAVEIEALSMIFRGESGVKAFADMNGIMLEVLADGINEKAADIVGDSILELDDEMSIYEEYSEIVGKRIVHSQKGSAPK